MNSKSIVFVAFAVWSFICWRWYVCGLMHACDADTDHTEEVVAVPDERLDTFSGVSKPPVSKETVEPATGKSTKSTDATAPVTTPETKSKPVTPSRMEEVQMEKVEDRMVIYFPYKSSRKEDNAAIDAYLAELAAYLNSSGKKVTITGHTDFVGEPAENYQFGLRRATGIRDILVKKGVPKSQILCKSSGDKKPVATNDTPYGRYLNRRAEIRVAQ